MFKEKGIVVMYESKNGLKGSRYEIGIGKTYTELFLTVLEDLDEHLQGNYVITNVVKL